MRWMMIALWFVSLAVQAQDLNLQPVAVAPDVYAVVGDLAGQTYENDGLNNNLGFVVSDAGVLVNAVQPATLRLAPPLIVQPMEIDQAVSILERVLSSMPAPAVGATPAR